MAGISHTLYTLLVWLAQPLLRRKLARRALAEPGYAQAVPERFGRYTHPAEPRSELVWLHAVSLGESRAAGILMQTLREAMPGVRFLLTHGTATGRAEGQRHLRAGDVQVWLPWDTTAAVQRFLRHFKPRLGLLMETEVWPVLVRQSRAAGVPLALVNARMSEKSLRSALRWTSLMQPSYAALTAVWAQTETDAQRLRALGAQVQAVTGNLKFDARPDAAQCAQAQAWRSQMTRPVLMFASSREGEEAQWLQAVQALPDAWRAALWLIVPRHPQRMDEVQALFTAAGLTVSRRSSWPEAGPQTDAQQSDVWLGDSLGEMALYYRLSDAALLGGSFAPLGGQNLIEAAACACPVFMGMHTFNFEEVAQQAEAEGAARRVPDMAHAVQAALAALADGPDLQEWRGQALRFAQSHSGAVQRVAKLVEDLSEFKAPAAR